MRSPQSFLILCLSLALPASLALSDDSSSGPIEVVRLNVDFSTEVCFDRGLQPGPPDDPSGPPPERLCSISSFPYRPIDIELRPTYSPPGVRLFSGEWRDQTRSATGHTLYARLAVTRQVYEPTSCPGCESGYSLVGYVSDSEGSQARVSFWFRDLSELRSFSLSGTERLSGQYGYTPVLYVGPALLVVPIPSPTPWPTLSPIPSGTPSPLPWPSATPSWSPTPWPSATPSWSPTPWPSSLPSWSPGPVPSSIPTWSPSPRPTR